MRLGAARAVGRRPTARAARRLVRHKLAACAVLRRFDLDSGLGHAQPRRTERLAGKRFGYPFDQAVAIALVDSQPVARLVFDALPQLAELVTAEHLWAQMGALATGARRLGRRAVAARRSATISVCSLATYVS